MAGFAGGVVVGAGFTGTGAGAGGGASAGARTGAQAGAGAPSGADFFLPCFLLQKKTTLMPTIAEIIPPIHPGNAPLGFF